MKLIITATAIFTIILLSLALLNLIIIFDKKDCMCSSCLGACVYRNQEIPAECSVEDYNSFDCSNYSCKELLGDCRKVPKVLEFNTYIRGHW